jgi:amidase
VPVDPQCSTAAQATARLLEELGHDVQPFDASSIHDDAGPASMGAVIAASVARDIGRWEELVGATVAEGDLEPMTEASLAWGRAMGAAEYVEHLDVLARWSRRIAQATGPYDVVVSPTMAVLPPALGTISPDRPLEESIPVFSAMTAFALPFDVSGQPAVSLPLHWSNEGLPVGVQVVAAYGREDLVLRLAGQLERARPWADRWPSIAFS